jgi:hypothetical protein
MTTRDRFECSGMAAKGAAVILLGAGLGYAALLTIYLGASQLLFAYGYREQRK